MKNNDTLLVELLTLGAFLVRFRHPTAAATVARAWEEIGELRAKVARLEGAAGKRRRKGVSE